jgi:hypothetical protein
MTMRVSGRCPIQVGQMLDARAVRPVGRLEEAASVAGQLAVDRMVDRRDYAACENSDQCSEKMKNLDASCKGAL